MAAGSRQQLSFDLSKKHFKVACGMHAVKVLLLAVLF
jgi:hypothetical protein